MSDQVAPERGVTADQEWHSVQRDSAADQCPECPHKTTDHTARVGEGYRICAWCPCDRYAHYA